MLENLDLTQKLEKDFFKQTISGLELKLGELQRQVRERKIPVIIVFEGWDAAGKGTLINQLLLALDPRGFKVFPTNPPTTEEQMRPFLWRFWMKTPAAGQFAILDRSWYGRVLVARVDKLVKKKVWSQAYVEINTFERQLSEDGCVVIKFFLQISQKEQFKRFRKLEKNSATAWKVTQNDWKHHDQYKKYLAATEEMLAKTDTAFSPWTTVEAHDQRFAVTKIFQTIIQTLEKRVAIQPAKPIGSPAADPVPLVEWHGSVLTQIDLTRTLGREEYEKLLKKSQQRLRELEHEAFLQRLPVVIVYEGCDAAGKGGNIRRLVQGMDPRGYEVIPIAAPSDEEKAHHYLWRFWRAIPKAGHIAIFDRSWYGRVLVERVEGFCTETDWKRAFREINEFENQLTHFGTVLVKFWLQIDPDEQLRRFNERQENPHKRWKITDEDWRNREKWEQYAVAVDEMLQRTSAPDAPWTIVESNSKLFARIKTLKTVIKAIEEKL
jgi:polyphosphate kinase 2 (PPK2 family)